MVECSFIGRAATPCICSSFAFKASIGFTRWIYKCTWWSQWGIVARTNHFYHVHVMLNFTLLLCFGLQVHLYQKIRAANITYVSIGHRSSLYDYHERILRISTFDSDNEQLNWCIEPTTPKSSLKFTNLWASVLAISRKHGSIALNNSFDVYDVKM